MSVVIVGGSVAGIATARALRDYGYDGTITVLESEYHLPYDKPPLSKQMLARTATDPAPLLAADELETLGVDLRLGMSATGLDVQRQIVRTGGTDVNYQQLVIATGLRARTLPEADGWVGVYTLRTANDAVRLRAALPDACNVVIIGGGFIGSEVACAAAKYGCVVTIVEVQAEPLAHALGAEVGSEISQLHRRHGVSMRTRSQVAGFVGDGHVRGVRLSDGSELTADLVVVGVGAVAATEWLRTSGLPIDNGVRCDEHCRVTEYPGIFAVGDVAERQHPLYGEPLRIEHWTNAGELGRIAAAGIAGVPAPECQPPYVWSELYDKRIQVVGRPSAGRLVAQSGTVDDGMAAVYADDFGVAVGGVVVDNPRMLMTCRRAILGRHFASQIALDGQPRKGVGTRTH